MAGPCFGEVPRKTYRCGDELIAVARWFLKTTFFPPSCRVMTSGVTRALVNHGCFFFVGGLLSFKADGSTSRGARAIISFVLYLKDIAVDVEHGFMSSLLETFFLGELKAFSYLRFRYGHKRFDR